MGQLKRILTPLLPRCSRSGQLSSRVLPCSDGSTRSLEISCLSLGLAVGGALLIICDHVLSAGGTPDSQRPSRGAEVAQREFEFDDLLDLYAVRAEVAEHFGYDWLHGLRLPGPGAIGR